MISKREVTEQQVNEWCRQRSLAILPPRMFSCSGRCVRVEPVIARDTEGKSLIECGKCCEKCPSCEKYIVILDDEASCWYCNDTYLEIETCNIDYSDTELVNTTDDDEGDDVESSSEDDDEDIDAVDEGTKKPAGRYLQKEIRSNIPTADPKSLRRRI